MRVVVNSRIFQEKYSGVQNYVSSLYSKLQSAPDGDAYVFLQTRKTVPLGDTAVGGYVRGNLGKILFDWLLILFPLRKIGGGVLHGPAFVLPLFKPKGYRYAVSVHDFAFLVHPEHYPWVFRTYLRLAIRNSLRVADAVMCISESTKNDLLRFFPKTDPAKVKVVPLGVDEDFFVAPESGRLIAEKYLFSLTTHPRRKNIPRILEVLSEHRGALSGYKYVIAGIFGPDSMADMRAHVARHRLEDVVVLFGYASHDQVKSLYRHAEMLVYPSYYEGFWLPVLEAMAAGCPVICSNNSSLPEVNPNAECLFDADSNADIYRKIRYVLDLGPEKRAELVARNVAFARSMNWDATARMTRDIFHSLQG